MFDDCCGPCMEFGNGDPLAVDIVPESTKNEPPKASIQSVSAPANRVVATDAQSKEFKCGQCNKVYTFLDFKSSYQ